MSSSIVSIESLLSDELMNTILLPSKPKDHHHSVPTIPISTMLALLNPKYQPTLEALLKFQSTSPTNDLSAIKPLSFTAEDIQLIANQALRISNEQQIIASPGDMNGPSLVGLPNQQQQHPSSPAPPTIAHNTTAFISIPSTFRLNKFVRILHDMLVAEVGSGIVEWRRGLLVLHSTDAFAKTILPKYFNTRNFKTFRRQLNYYGFVHVRSFSRAGSSSTTALWVNRELAQSSTDDDIGSVLMLRRVEPTEINKTAEGRRVRKEQAIHTVEDDIGVNQKSLQMEQIRNLAAATARGVVATDSPPLATVTMDAATATGMPPSRGRHAIEDENASAANLLLLLSRS